LKIFSQNLTWQNLLTSSKNEVTTVLLVCLTQIVTASSIIKHKFKKLLCAWFYVEFYILWLDFGRAGPVFRLDPINVMS